MNDDPIEIETMFPEKYEPNWDELKTPKNEDQFGEAAFELLKEAGVYSTLVAALIPHTPLQRNDAILGAFVVKASKLALAIIAMSVHLGGDRLLALMRELIEELAILNYLLSDKDGSRFDQYIFNSLVSEREFVKTISSNTKKRNSSLPIENSMMKSISETAISAGIKDLSTLPARKNINWPNAETLISDMSQDIYLSYRSGSAVIHTQWADIFKNHLNQTEEGVFEINFDKVRVRPQPLYGAGIFIIISLEKYLLTKRPDALDVFKDRLSNLSGRIFRLVKLHGIYLDN